MNLIPSCFCEKNTKNSIKQVNDCNKCDNSKQCESSEINCDDFSLQILYSQYQIISEGIQIINFNKNYTDTPLFSLKESAKTCSENILNSYYYYNYYYSHHSLNFSNIITCLYRMNLKCKFVISYCYTNSNGNIESGILTCNTSLLSDWSSLDLINIEYIQGTPITSGTNLIIIMLRECDVLNQLILLVNKPLQLKKCVSLNITNSVNMNFTIALSSSGYFSYIKKCKSCAKYTKIFNDTENLYPNFYINYLKKYSNDEPLEVNLYFNTPNLQSKLHNNQTGNYNFQGLYSRKIKVGLYSDGVDLFMKPYNTISITSGLLSTEIISPLIESCNQ